jgi:hypothetical protein
LTLDSHYMGVGSCCNWPLAGVCFVALARVTATHKMTFEQVWCVWCATRTVCLTCGGTNTGVWPLGARGRAGDQSRHSRSPTAWVWAAVATGRTACRCALCCVGTRHSDAHSSRLLERVWPPERFGSRLRWCGCCLGGQHESPSCPVVGSGMGSGMGSGCNRPDGLPVCPLCCFVGCSSQRRTKRHLERVWCVVCHQNGSAHVCGGHQGVCVRVCVECVRRVFCSVERRALGVCQWTGCLPSLTS